MEQDRTKILCIGFPKSGTTTLFKAFKKAGFDAVHRRRKGKKPEGYRLYRSYIRDYTWTGADVITQLDTCRKDVNVWPQLDYEFLKWASQHSKMILQYRSPEKILRSIKDHNDLRKRIAYAPGLFGAATTDGDILRWIEKHLIDAKRAVPEALKVCMDDSDARDRIAKFIGVDLPWWGVANATRR